MLMQAHGPPDQKYFEEFSKKDRRKKDRDEDRVQDGFTNAAYAIVKNPALNNNIALRHSMKREFEMSPFVNGRHINDHRVDKRNARRAKKMKREQEVLGVDDDDDDTTLSSTVYGRAIVPKMPNINNNDVITVESTPPKAMRRAYTNNLDINFARNTMSYSAVTPMTPTTTPTNGSSQSQWEEDMCSACLTKLSKVGGEEGDKYLALFAVLSTKKPENKYTIAKNVYNLTKNKDLEMILETMIRFFA